MSGYEEIIDMPHHVSDKRPRMSQRDRAAQFSPFAALTGYDEAVNETARLTDVKAELTDDMKALLDRKTAVLTEYIHEKPEITVIYFSPDFKKEGGKYIQIQGSLRRIDNASAELVFTDGRRVRQDAVYSIESDLFNDMII